ncbi:MAG: alanine--glyoxylate aminotransferase family protein [Gemmatimonadota bacterium]|nr:alanine--glyoxylate aminotransferase family protein [Gemmatimonadota bacterium]
MTDTHPPFGKFFLPGPTEVRPEVLQAMVRPVIGHRGPAMRDLLGGMATDLGALFGTSRPVYVSTSSATGLMEAAIVNLASRGVLALVCGAFGDRFRKIAERCGRPVDVLRVEPGEPNLPAALRARLAAEPGRFDLVTVVHSETSTGVLNPVAEIAAAVREFEDVLLAVDGVTSVGGVPIRFDAWGADFLLTGSQKALALPPGLALGVASERALERARRMEARSYYFDLLDFERRAREHQTPNTPAVSLFYALAHQVARIGEEGLDVRFARHRDMAARTAAWVDGISADLAAPFGILAREGYRSPTVTAVTLPDGVAGSEVVRALAGRGWTIATGYGDLRDRCVRIGHMGDHTAEELGALLDELRQVLSAALAGRPSHEGVAR